MFELVDAPELRELQQKVASLEQERNEAETRASQLRVAVRDAHFEDIAREAAALNADKRPAKPKEPELKAQLEGAERRLEVLQHRLALAQSDVSKYVQAHHEELYALLDEAQRAEAAKVAEGARKLLAGLSRYYAVDEDVKAMRPMLPGPPETGPPGSADPTPLTQVFMGLTTQKVMGGPQRGEIEETLRYLASLADEPEEAEGAA
jgi:hypothetical protein